MLNLKWTMIFTLSNTNAQKSGTVIIFILFYFFQKCQTKCVCLYIYIYIYVYIVKIHKITHTIYV